MLAVDEEKKSNLCYTRLIPFRVSDAHLRGFTPEPTQSRLQRWRVIRNERFTTCTVWWGTLKKNSSEYTWIVLRMLIFLKKSKNHSVRYLV